MATRRFCDICDQQLKPEDAQPFVRAFEYRPPGEDTQDGFVPLPLKAVAYVEITNENNKPLTDICNGCKLLIVTHGKPTTKPGPTPIATLQPEVAADVQPSVTPFRAPPTPPSALLPEKPPLPTPPPMVFESSLPGDRPSPRQG
jgi:hypothetical protein